MDNILPQIDQLKKLLNKYFCNFKPQIIEQNNREYYKKYYIKNKRSFKKSKSI
jgi:hypothetical protein|tara:strand:- start:714 stop:872 length:159 start_codon:yes stop_codon:yes gene_type:complete